MHISSNQMFELIKKTIISAYHEERLYTGILNCIENLYQCDPVKILTVALSDSTSDLFSQKVLETYCYEQQIPFVKIDLKALKRILSILSTQRDTRTKVDWNCMCVLVMKPSNLDDRPDESELVKLIRLYESENDTLVVFNSTQQETTPSPTSAAARWPASSFRSSGTLKLGNEESG